MVRGNASKVRFSFFELSLCCQIYCVCQTMSDGWGGRVNAGVRRIPLAPTLGRVPTSAAAARLCRAKFSLCLHGSFDRGRALIAFNPAPIRLRSD